MNRTTQATFLPSKREKKSDGAVFTKTTSSMIELEREAGYIQNPDIPYWEDSVGSGNLVVALASAMFVDMAEHIPDAKERIEFIFKHRIFMNDINDSFIDQLLINLNQLVKTLTRDDTFGCSFNIAKADTIDPHFDPHQFWGFEYYRTITNRSYTIIMNDDFDPTYRKKLLSSYRDQIFPGNARTGKTIKVTDCGQIKAINDPLWLGGVDLRPTDIPVTLQTSSIRSIDFSNSTRQQFISELSSAGGAAIEVVVVQYDIPWNGPRKIIHGWSEQQIVPSAKELWDTYYRLTNISFSGTNEDNLLNKIQTNCSFTLGDYCDVTKSGITLGTGNKADVVGDLHWSKSLIKSKGLEPQAIVPHVDTEDVIVGGLDQKSFMLLPSSDEPKALQYYFSLFKNPNSIHRVPREKKSGWRKWASIGPDEPLLVFRYSADFSSANKRGLAIGFAKGFIGAGQTGSTGFAQMKSSLDFVSRFTKEQYIKILLVILHSSFGDFLKGHFNKQHNRSEKLVQGVDYKSFPLFDLDVPQAQLLLPITDQLLKLHEFDRTVVDRLVFSCMPFLSEEDIRIILNYLERRRKP